MEILKTIGIIFAILFVIVLIYQLVRGILSTVIEIVKGIGEIVLNVISFLSKFLVGGIVTWGIYELQPFEIESFWGKLAFLIVGGLILSYIVGVLSRTYRLVCYSVNFAMTSFVITLIVDLLVTHTALPGFIYVILAFAIPRITWVIDRYREEYTLKESKNHHPVLGWLGNFEMTTERYSVKSADMWEDDPRSWRHLPVQIVLASVFYGCGSRLLVLSAYPDLSTWILTAATLLAIAVNALFDIFVFRNIDLTISCNISLRPHDDVYIDNFDCDDSIDWED